MYDHKDPASIWTAPALIGALIIVLFCGLIICAIGGKLCELEPEQPTWIATYEDTRMPDWCARGTIGSDHVDIVEAPYKDGHLYQIWYDNTVFWHYESDYTLPDFTVFTNGDWTVSVDVYDFKGGNSYATNRGAV